jgi:hypothetical protein
MERKWKIVGEVMKETKFYLLTLVNLIEIIITNRPKPFLYHLEAANGAEMKRTKVDHTIH